MKIRLLPLLAAALVAAACEKESATEPRPVEPVDSTPRVRFFNATTGMAGEGGFTMNGEFVAGSALAFGQATEPCPKVDAGTILFGFGAASPGGTALTGDVLATLPSTNIGAGGNFTVAAAGNGKHALLFMLSNNIPGALGSNQAAVRFVNLAAATAEPFNVMMGTSAHATNLELGTASTFATVPSGSTAFSVLHGEEVVISGSAGTLNLQAGTVNTVAIVHNGAMGAGFKLVNLTRCS